MGAAPIVIIITRPRRVASREVTEQSLVDQTKIQVLVDPDATDAEILAAALAQVQRED